MKLILILTFSIASIASSVKDEFSFGLGLANVSFQESESGLEGENADEAADGSVSLITANLQYKFLHMEKFSLLANGSFPILSSNANSYFSAGLGVEYYFSKENNIVREKKINFSYSIDPVFRYYATGGINLGYLSYSTETKLKNDVNLELSLGGGAIYSFMEQYGVKGDLVIGKGIGALTSTLNIKLFVSAVYYILD